MGTEKFDARRFLARLQMGEFDGKLHQVIRALSLDQLEQVATLMAESLRKQSVR